MLKIVLSILLFSACFSSRADIDSLRNIVQTTKNIPDKIDALTELGGELIFTDFDASIMYFEQAFTLLRSHDYPEKYAWNLNYYGYAVMIAGNYNEARDSLQKSVEIAEKLQKPKLISRSLMDIATSYYYEGKLESALTYCRKALKPIGEFPKNEAIIYNNMGIFTKSVGDFEQATDHYISALKCFQEIKDTALMISALNNIAFLFTEIKFYERAIYYHSRAIKLSMKTKDSEGLARGYTGMALIKDHLGIDTEAITYNNKAIKIYKELGLKKELLSTQYNLADFYYARKDYNRSLSILIEVRAEFERINAIAEFAISTSTIGLIYYQQKDFENAKLFLEEAYTIQQYIENPTIHKSMLINLSNLYESTGEFEKALETNKRYELIKDSLLYIEKAERIAMKEAIYRYNESLKELEGKEAELNYENEKNKKTSTKSNWILYGVIGLGTIIVFLLLAYFKETKKRKQLREAKDKAQVDLESLEADYQELLKKLEVLQTSNVSSSLAEKVKSLSKRELEILSCLSLGMTDIRIGEKLFISASTVNSHCARIYSKLDVKNRTEASKIIRDFDLNDVT